MTPLRFRRRGGVLCHITSLPGAGDIGTLGAGAREFVDFIGDAGLSIWQMLPLNPPDSYRSPYHSSSLFALDPNLLDPALGLSDPTVLEHFVSARGDAFDRFASTQAFWLTDYCRFVAASALHGPDWLNWPVGLRMRASDALERFDRDNRRAIEVASMRQFAVDEGFANLRFEAAARGVALFGDMPLYPAFDSADVWAHQDVFLLDTNQRPSYVAGVPPDYFSANGQLWGNPVYDWDTPGTGRIRLVDRAAEGAAAVVRHGADRSLQRSGGVLGDTARRDRCVGRHLAARRPGDALLERASRSGRTVAGGRRRPRCDHAGRSMHCANAFELPGMRVLQFAFSGDPHNPHLPSNYVANTVAYTGTHDNDTTLGWYHESRRATCEASVDRLPDSVRHAVVADRPRARVGCARLRSFRCRISSRSTAMHRMNTPGVADGKLALALRLFAADAGSSRTGSGPRSSGPVGLEHDAGERRQRQRQRLRVAHAARRSPSRSVRRCRGSSRRSTSNPN